MGNRSGAITACVALLLLSCSEASSPATGLYEVTFDDGFTIWAAVPESAGVRPVYSSDSSAYDVSWSPDGQWAVFMRQQPIGTPNYRLVVVDVSTAVERPLTAGPNHSGPAWSPDGSTIAYLNQVSGGDAELRLVRPDGSGDHRLDTAWYYVRSPEWSPDSRFIAATRNDFMIVIVDAVSGAFVREVSPGMSPTWSPDGRRLAFSYQGLAIADADGTNRRIIAPSAYEPAWSPDGHWIAFDRGSGEILLASPSQRDTTEMKIVGAGMRPAWRRQR